MFAKIFAQIYDSSIVESPETRFTFMDFLILSDRNGVVDMTHEAIARRTNRPIEVIRRTITELEGPDPRSRTSSADGARILRLDEHRDWGWVIVNYDYFRKLSSEEQRREKTLLRVRRHRGVTHCNVVQRTGNDSPSPSLSPSASGDRKGSPEGKGRCTQVEAEEFCKSLGLPKSDGTAMWLHWEEKGWAKVKDWRLTIRKWQSFGYLPSQKNRKLGAFSERSSKLDPSKIDVPERFKSWAATAYPDKRETVMKWQTWADVPGYLREEWWSKEKKKLPVGDLL